MDLFDYMRETQQKESPLASRMRPKTLDEVVGQKHIIGKNTMLYRAIKADKLSSVIFYGPPGTGKTTLLHILYEYLRTGKQSGYSVTTNAEYFVYLRDEVGRSWQDALYPLKNTVIFIEENNHFIFGTEFAKFVKESGNYFVLISRSPLKTLPDLPTPSTILRNGARRVSLPMMTGSSWGSPPRKAKQNICTILISKKLWKTEPCS